MDKDATHTSSASTDISEAGAAAKSPAVGLAEKQVPISFIANRYFLFDVDDVLHVRRVHHICGVFVGGIPHVPHQNVFLGLPLELMPEEARLLVEQGHAYVVDDVKAHKRALLGERRDNHHGGNNGMSSEERKAILHTLKTQGRDAARAAQKKSGEKREKALIELQEKKTKKNNTREDNRLNEKSAQSTASAAVNESTDGSTNGEPPKKTNDLFQPDLEPLPSSSTAATANERFYITPTTSSLIFSSQSQSQSLSQSQIKALPPVPSSSYPLFIHLHANNYFLAPGLRFGCQYMAYPGDPLRYHSHFLANGLGWDEEFDLLDLVGGGRLGTGVKKSFVIGGLEGEDCGNGKGKEDNDGNDGLSVGKERKVRAFSIEWAGM